MEVIFARPGKNNLQSIMLPQAKTAFCVHPIISENNFQKSKAYFITTLIPFWRVT
jgi:hypothetical protein